MSLDRFKRLLGQILFQAGHWLPPVRRPLAHWGLRTRGDWFAGTVPTMYSQRTGARLRLPSFTENYLSFTVFWQGLDYYEPVSTTLAQMLTRRPDGLLVDAGANIGFYSLMLAALRPGLKIVAFEPHPHLAELLRANVRANDFRHVTVEAMALSEHEGVLPFYLNRSHMSASLERSFDSNHTDVVSVPTTGLDRYMERRGEPVPERFLLKLDIEGHEPAFFRGASATLARSQPDIIAEVAVPYPEETVRALRDLGYRFRQITHQGLRRCDVPVAHVEGPLVFLNCLLSTRSDAELDALSTELAENCRSLDLRKTSKVADSRVRDRFKAATTRDESAAGSGAPLGFSASGRVG